MDNLDQIARIDPNLEGVCHLYYFEKLEDGRTDIKLSMSRWTLYFRIWWRSWQARKIGRTLNGLEKPNRTSCAATGGLSQVF